MCKHPRTKHKERTCAATHVLRSRIQKKNTFYNSDPDLPINVDTCLKIVTRITILAHSVCWQPLAYSIGVTHT